MYDINRCLTDLCYEAFNRACDGIDACFVIQRLATEAGERLRAAGCSADYEYRLDGTAAHDLDALTKALGHEPTWREGIAFQRCVRAALWFSLPPGAA